MRYKSAKGLLLEIGEDKQASSGTRLDALEMLARVEKLPELKGYKSGSRENLLLRLASDSSRPAKDRLRALRQLLDEENSPNEVNADCERAPGVKAAPISSEIREDT